MSKFLLLAVACGCLIGQGRSDTLLVQVSPGVGVNFPPGVTSIDPGDMISMMSSLAGVTPPTPAWEGIKVISPFKTAHTINMYSVSSSVFPVMSSMGRWHQYVLKAGLVDIEGVFSYLKESLDSHGATVDAAVHNLTDLSALSSSLLPSSAALSISRRLILNHVHVESTADLDRLLMAISAGAAIANAQADIVLLAPPSDDHSKLRTRRAADTPSGGLDRNLAEPADPEFAAIFNIILFSSLFLLFISVTFIMMLAYMDPGLDSVIYRVTNPNKKYN